MNPTYVLRPLALAQALEPDRYEIHFACAYRYERYEHLFQTEGGDQ